MIGDCRTAALVCRNGSIDWSVSRALIPGRLFAALLGTSDNGRWLIEPRQRISSPAALSWRQPDSGDDFRHRHRQGAGDRLHAARHADSAIVRIVEAVEGHVDMHTELVIRFDYGMTIPWVRAATARLTAVAGPHLLTFRTRAEVHGENMRSVAAFTVKKGDACPLYWLWSVSRAVAPVDRFIIALEETEQYWQHWAGICQAPANGAAPSCARC